MITPTHVQHYLCASLYVCRLETVFTSRPSSYTQYCEMSVLQETQPGNTRSGKIKQTQSESSALRWSQTGIGQKNKNSVSPQASGRCTHGVTAPAGPATRTALRLRGVRNKHPQTNIHQTVCLVWRLSLPARSSQFAEKKFNHFITSGSNTFFFVPAFLNQIQNEQIL